MRWTTPSSTRRRSPIHGGPSSPPGRGSSGCWPNTTPGAAPSKPPSNMRLVQPRRWDWTQAPSSALPASTSGLGSRFTRSRRRCGGKRWMAWPRAGSAFALPRRLIAALALVTVARGAAVFFGSGFAGLALRLWLVGVGALLFWALSGAALRIWAVPGSPGFTLPPTWRRRPPPERLRQLEELERAVDFALGTAFDLHFCLRPHLARAATPR